MKNHLNNRKENPIPPHAKSVFEGVRWKVFQWEQELFDGKVKTYESLKRPDSVSVLPVLDGKNILVLEEHQPHWHEKSFGIVGGGLEENENPEIGAKRELL